MSCMVLSRYGGILGVLSLILICCSGVRAQQSEKSPFAGEWDSKINDLPGIKITIKQANGEIGGTIVVYFHERGTDGKWHVTDKYEAPLLFPKIVGKNLRFEVAHHKTHDSPEFGPNVKFRMEVTGSDEAALYRAENETDRGLKLTRRTPK